MSHSKIQKNILAILAIETRIHSVNYSNSLLPRMPTLYAWPTFFVPRSMILPLQRCDTIVGSKRKGADWVTQEVLFSLVFLWMY